MCRHPSDDAAVFHTGPAGRDLGRVTGEPLHGHGERRARHLVACELHDHPVPALDGRRVGAGVGQRAVAVELCLDLKWRQRGRQEQSEAITLLCSARARDG